MNFYVKKLCLPMYAMLALIGCGFVAHAEPINAEKAKESRNRIECQKAKKGTLTPQEEKLIIDEDNVMEPFPG